ncbi:SDR family oxidoreductase [Alicyclobacillus vulcanalis]|uniref:NAD(P)-dependent dehydrogenase, short-chain alcohol dehydrogenase family n=1 Tax=Alicyclobacillus vulcanalis TaxID=252246 RepID=A0A1N7P083_9BACL|nr:SDR family oxidoreductase [Alicyclobacillus vulcanalis]SIT03958.1 NAD(P)-dependent dehydrogenase, short-chain alcohol dehydrogenase family [Alicyclobacillus vulcanalis]
MRLQDRIAVITGAASGMGRAMAMLFAEEGAQVLAADIDAQGLDGVAQAIREMGGRVETLVANMASADDVNAMIDRAVEQFGGIDILVNNAGIMDGMKAAHEVTDDLWERVFSVNVTGPMRAIRRALPVMMEKKRGAIVNIASVGGLFGSRAGAAYTASKHAIVGLTKNVAYQYARFGIRCNAIAPGGVETNIMGSSPQVDPASLGVQAAMAGMAINPRTGKPDEIARAALFLASDEASFINGAILVADAGWTAY